MSIGLLEQLSVYYESEAASQKPITAEEIKTVLEIPTVLAPAPIRRRRGVWIAVAIAIATISVIGLLPLLLAEETPPADTVVPTTLADPVPPTTVPEATPPSTVIDDVVLPAGVPLTNVFPRIAYADVEAEVGSISWTKLEGDADTIPNELLTWFGGKPGMGFTQEEDGSYLYIATDRVWRSEDGFSWTFEEGTIPDPGFVVAEWTAGNGLEVTHTDANNTRTFPLANQPRPDVEGLDLELNVRPPMLFDDDLVYVPGVWEGTLPWADYYGTFGICETGGECFSEPPRVEVGVAWIDNARHADENTAWVRHPESGRVLETLTIETTQTSITFMQSETGRVIHEIVGSKGIIEKVVENLMANQTLRPLSLEVAWIGSETKPFNASNGAPETPGIIAIPDGGLGQFWGLNRQLTDNEPQVQLPLTPALITHDGVTWQEIWPNFLTDAVYTTWIFRKDDQLKARVHYRLGGEELWASTNGVDWVRQYQYPADTQLINTDYGLVSVSTRYIGLAVGYPDIFVSTDNGETWANIPGPPNTEYNQYPEGSSEWIGVAGNIIWIQIDGTPRNNNKILWIGKLEK